MRPRGPRQLPCISFRCRSDVKMLKFSLWARCVSHHPPISDTISPLAAVKEYHANRTQGCSKSPIIMVSQYQEKRSDGTSRRPNTSGDACAQQWLEQLFLRANRATLRTASPSWFVLGQ